MTVGGKVEFKDTSEEAKNGMLEQQKQAMKAVAKFLKKAVKDATPVDTENLKKNVAVWVRVMKKTGEVKIEIGIYDAKRAAKKGLSYAFYAHMVEFGTSKMPAKPFLKDTVRANVAAIRNELAKYLPNIEPVVEYVDEDAEEAEDV